MEEKFHGGIFLNKVELYLVIINNMPQVKRPSNIDEIQQHIPVSWQHRHINICHLTYIRKFYTAQNVLKTKLRMSTSLHLVRSFNLKINRYTKKCRQLFNIKVKNFLPHTDNTIKGRFNIRDTFIQIGIKFIYKSLLYSWAKRVEL